MTCKHGAPEGYYCAQCNMPQVPLWPSYETRMVLVLERVAVAVERIAGRLESTEEFNVGGRVTIGHTPGGGPR